MRLLVAALTVVAGVLPALAQTAGTVPPEVVKDLAPTGKLRAAINLGTFVGATQVRGYVLGFENRPPTPAELEKMKSLVAEAMKDGALGVSTSLIYSPAIYAKTDELVELARVAGQYGGIYASHIRNEGDHINEALNEAFRIGREAKIGVEIWHLKVAGKDMWGRMPEVLKKIEDARANGLDVQADQYPYIAAATSLAACMPPWAHEGGREKLIERLKQAEADKEAMKEYENIDSASDVDHPLSRMRKKN